MMLDTRIYVFKAVADQKSFTLAAQQLYMTRIPREKTFCLKQVCFRKYLALCHNILPLRSPHFHPNLQNQDASPRISLPFPGIIGRQTNSSVLQAQIRDDFSSGYSAHRWNTSL